MKLTTFLLAAATATISTPVRGNDFTALRTTVTEAPRQYHMCGVDIHTTNNHQFQTSSATCFLQCSQAPIDKCGGASWSKHAGGTCWYKGTNAMMATTNPDAGVDSTIKLANIYTGSSVVWFDIRDGYSMEHNDLPNNGTKRASIEDCKPDCESNEACFAVTWTPHEGGTCWLKSRASKLVAKAGSKSVFLGRDVGRANYLCK